MYSLIENSIKLGGVPITRKMPESRYIINGVINFKVNDGDIDSDRATNIEIDPLLTRDELVIKITNAVDVKIEELNL